MSNPINAATRPSAYKYQAELEQFRPLLSPQAYAALDSLSKETGDSPRETIRRALSAESFLREHVKDGNKILIQEEGQNTPTRVAVFK